MSNFLNTSVAGGKGRMTLHCGSQLATLDEISEVELPEATASYVPVGHADIDRLLKQEIRARIPEAEIEPSYALNREGKQCFGLLGLNFEGEGGHSLVIAFRNSYDKSMSIGVASGVSVWLCDNLCISGQALTIVRKHTGNVWDEFEKMGMQTISRAQEHFEKTVGQLMRMKRIAVSKDEGFGELGRLVGKGLLQPGLFNVACREWRQKEHAQFPDRNLYRLYNNVTEALKKVSVQRALSRYTGVHDFFESRFPIQPESGVVIDMKPEVH